MVQFHMPSTYTTYGILPPEPIAQPPQGWGKLLLVGQARAGGQSQTVFVELKVGISSKFVNYTKSKPAVDVSVM